MISFSSTAYVDPVEEKVSRTTFSCKVCHKIVDRMNSIISKSVSMKHDCCSLKCFKTTPDYHDRRMRGDTLRIAKIRETGDFSRNGKSSKITRAKNFLASHNIPFDGLCDSDVLELWAREFRNLSNHSEKIAIGRLKKYGDHDAVRLADKERVLKSACSMLGITYSKNFSDDERKSITNEAYKNFRVKNVYAWKLKHILSYAHIENISELTPEAIDSLYSEYLSSRFSRSSLESDKNGYKNTEKGWYRMTNQEHDKFFYRSSWEKKVFEALDNLLGQCRIQRVITPKRIQYMINNSRRHYYPDIAFINASGSTIVLEIKPLKKIYEHVNALKISAAREDLGQNFHVLTETEIFNEDLLKILGRL